MYNLGNLSPEWLEEIVIDVKQYATEGTEHEQNIVGYQCELLQIYMALKSASTQT